MNALGKSNVIITMLTIEHTVNKRGTRVTQLKKRPNYLGDCAGSI